MTRCLRTLLLGAALIGPGAVLAHAPVRAETQAAPALTTYYRNATVDGVNMFYREAGPANGPVILLLHGFPTSSHMFRNLIPVLADKYHVVAPDFPGYGQSSTPNIDEFLYTFDNLTDVLERFMDRLELPS